LVSRAASIAGAVMLALLAALGCAKIVGIGTLPYPPDATATDDGGDEAETAGDDGGDAGDAGTCVAVPVNPPIPDSGGPGCSGPDGSSCRPLDETGFSWKFVRPLGMHLDRCTKQQSGDFYDFCVGTMATKANCDAWRNNASNANCLGCLLSSDADKAFGVTITTGIGVYFNGAGCMALVEPCNQLCALASQSASECARRACGGCATFADFPACVTAAEVCSACMDYQSATECVTQLVADPAHHPSVAICGFGQSDQVLYDSIAAFMCGP
jgi:hypothetical protein